MALGKRFRLAAPLFGAAGMAQQPPAAQPEPEKKPVQVAAVPRFTLSLGTYANEAELKASLAKLKGLGLNPVTGLQPGS